MSYSTFNQTASNPLLEPMFFGNSVNVARYDQTKTCDFREIDRETAESFSGAQKRLMSAVSRVVL